VLYSAGQNKIARDRLSDADRDPNSVFTRVLLRHMADRASLVDLAKTLQQEVSVLARTAGYDQLPAYYDQLEGRPMLAGEAVTDSPAQPALPSPDPRAEELAYWTASNCAAGDLDGCRAYQAKFGPGGRFADLAALKLRPAPQPAPAAADPNAAARAAIAGISAADWNSRSGDQLLASVLARANLAQIKALANTGDARAQTLVAIAFDWGRGGEAQDFAQAMTWYRKAADQGNAWAQNSVGALYHNGQGVKQDYAQAMTWYRKAADQGDATAQANIGVLYDNGLGVKQDYAQAMTWYRKAADQGNAFAQASIGFLYDNGHGVKQDYAQAMTWYRKAADQGNAFAQASIGFLYANGRGVQQDYAQAMTWYRKAADQGETTAQYNIGDLYANGHGVPPRAPSLG
jgi:TPR repeat protein